MMKRNIIHPRKDKISKTAGCVQIIIIIIIIIITTTTTTTGTTTGIPRLRFVTVSCQILENLPKIFSLLIGNGEFRMGFLSGALEQHDFFQLAQ
jgi:hypothetical protein